MTERTDDDIASARPVAHPSQPGSVALRLLGDPAVHLADGSVRALERRAAGLLALIALEPGVTRARAAALLWPQSDDGRKALRQQLSRFRKLFGAALVKGDDALQIDDGIATDLGTGGDRLLGGLSFEDCDDFADWLARQRAARRGAQVEPLQQALAQAESARDYEQALALAEQLLAVEPDSEAHQRTVIRLHYLRGDLAQAQAGYERLKRRLRTKFGTAPSAESEALARLLRSARPADTAVATVTTTAISTQTPPALLRPPRLIGRGRELAAMSAAWQAQRAVLLLGEAGLGKSRLLAEFAHGQRVLGVQARPGDPGVPYALLARLLRRVIEHCPLALAGDDRTELARLLPELAPDAPLQAEGQRLLLQRSIEALLAHATLDGAPLHGLLVDDLHFADAASVEMLQSLIGAPALGTLRWALAQRPGEGGDASAALRDALLEAGLMTVLPLAPLDEPALAQLIDSLQVPELDAGALAGALARHTGGNPLFALETLKHGLASGQLRDGRLPQPDSVGALIERRLGQLSPRALALARLAAIAGVDFSIELAEQVTGERALALADAWSELQAAQVLRDTAFAHDLVCDAVLRQVPAAIARHLHAAVAGLIQPHGEPARVAVHWAAAQRWHDAGLQWMAAAARARTASRREDELTLLLQAADAFAQTGDAAAEFDALLQAATATIYVDIGQQAAAIEERLLRLAQNDLQRTQALNELAFIAQSRGDRGECERHARAALALAERIGRPDLAFYAARSVAVALASLGRPAEALIAIDAHRDWVLAHGNEENRCEYFSDRSWALMKLSRLTEARESLRQASEIAERSDNLTDLSTTLFLLAGVDSQLGLADAAIAGLRQAIALNERLGHRSGVHGTQGVLLGRLLRDRGEYREALDLLTRGVAELTAGATVEHAAGARFVLSQLWLDLGQPARARAELPDEDPRWSPSYRGSWHLRHGAIEEALRRDGAARFAAGLAAIADDVGSLSANLRGALVVRDALARRDRLAFERVAALASDLLARQAFGFAIVALAAAAELAEDAGSAMRLAERARQLMAEYQPEACLPTEVWLLIGTAAGRHGEAALAQAMFARGADWIQRVAREHVPEEFRESFMHRNPTHRRLLELARRLG